MAKKAPAAVDLFSEVDKVSWKELQESYGLTTSINQDWEYKSGSGSRVKLYDHKALRSLNLLDMSCAISTKNIGYGNRALVRSLFETARELGDVAGYPDHDISNVYALKLAWLLTKHFPRKYEMQALFGNSGTEANEIALKLCFNARMNGPIRDRGRKEFLAFRLGFHGRTLGSLSITCSKPVQREGYPTNAIAVNHIPFPARHPFYFFSNNGEPRRRNVSATEYIEEFLADCDDGKIDLSVISAIFLELIPGEGGMVIPSKDAIEDLIRILKKNKVLIVVDEVQTAFGRTGKFYCFEHFNIDPDIVTSSKSIAGGLPISSVLYRKELGFTERGRQSSTFAGGPIPSAVARTVLREINQQNLPQRAKDLGDKVLGPALRMIAQDFPQVVHRTDGMGLMHGMEFWNRETENPAPDFRTKVMHEAIKRGVLFVDCGVSSIRLTPPLTITGGLNGDKSNEIGKATNVLRDSIEATLRKTSRII